MTFKRLTIWLVAIISLLLTLNIFALAQQNNLLVSEEIFKIISNQPTSNERFGQIVTIDEETIAIGAPGINNGGAVYLYNQNETNPTEWLYDQTLIEDDGRGSKDIFGSAIALQDNTLVVGAPLADSPVATAGRVYIYERADLSEQWKQKQILTLTNAVNGDEFGKAVALDDDTIVVGAPGRDSDTGAIYIYEHLSQTDSWILVKDFSQNDLDLNQVGIRFGSTVLVEDDLIMASAPLADNLDGTATDVGLVAMFQQDISNEWTINNQLFGDIERGHYGTAIALFDEWMAVGSPDTTNGGQVSLYQYDGSNWSNIQTVEALNATEGGGAIKFGYALAMEDELLLVGAYKFNRTIDDIDIADVGMSYVYQWNDNNEWVETRRLVQSDANSANQFGISVDVTDDVALVGADLNRHSDIFGAGSAYLFSLGNVAPVLKPIGSQVITVGQTLTFTALAEDKDGHTLQYLLIDSQTIGAMIDPNTGTFTWTPTETGIFELTIRVTETNSFPSNLYDEETLTISVFETGAASANFMRTEQQFGQNNSQAVVIGDMNGDGLADILIGNANLSTTRQANPGNEVWLNDGQGGFISTNQALGKGDTKSAVLIDFDHDGDLDTVFGNENDQANEVWLNDGTGIFTQTDQTIGTGNTQAIVFGDVNGDGHVDALLGNTSNQTNEVWLNDGSGIFTQTNQVLGNGDTQAVTLGDVNGDGNLDAIIGNSTNQLNQVWLNDGTGTFTQSQQTLGTGDTNAIVLGDVNQDGNLDAIVANDNAQANEVWLNDGTGIFTQTNQSLGFANSQAVVLGDMNNDGQLDAIISNAGSDGDTVWLNDGTGIFTQTNQTLMSQDSNSVALSDLDSDGDLDMFMVQGNDTIGQPNIVWINQNKVTITTYLPSVIKE